MFWKKKTSAATEESCAHALFKILVESLTKNGGTRAEDLITVSASIAAELCIEVAGDFNPRKHKFVPGSRVFSEKVNELFAGNSHDIETAPAKSIVGMLRDKVLTAGYTKADFPSLKTVFEHFAANIGKQSDWGKVPLSVPEANEPLVLPLRVAYETRATVDRVFHSLASPPLKLRAATLTLAEVLIAVQNAINKNTALLLALETVNGMAKTAPMTDEAIASANKKPADSSTT